MKTDMQKKKKFHYGLNVFSLPFASEKGLAKTHQPARGRGHLWSSDAPGPRPPCQGAGCSLWPCKHSTMRPPKYGDVFSSSSLEAAQRRSRWHGSLPAGAGRAKAGTGAGRAGFDPACSSARGDWGWPGQRNIPFQLC